MGENHHSSSPFVDFGVWAPYRMRTRPVIPHLKSLKSLATILLEDYYFFVKLYSIGHITLGLSNLLSKIYQYSGGRRETMKSGNEIGNEAFSGEYAGSPTNF